ncbi:MAG: BCD family MFS transporter [Hyphomonadaceae bacterium]|nr:BCD family MFS transporter [Hyphomonadaceae bacterium]
MTGTHLSWLTIVRLGLVQSALGAMVSLTTSTLNRVMVVEYALPAMLPAALVAWHYAIQLSRPRWGYGSDMGARRTPWIVGGMGVLALGAIGATDAAVIMATSPLAGVLLGVASFTLIGAGVGASGTSLLALLATHVAPERRPAAAATTWIMMIVGIVATAGIAGGLIDPFSPQRLAFVAAGVCAVAFLVTLLAVWGVEKGGRVRDPEEVKPPFLQALRETWADPTAQRFTQFVFLSMLAYSAQDLILEPFAGLLFGMTPGQSTQMSGVQHAGVLIGMILVGALGARVGDRKRAWLRGWTIAGCIGSALALGALALAAAMPHAWPLTPTVFVLGFANGVFAVAAIGSMMGLAGEGQKAREGVRMGVWGAAQAAAFACGGFAGAAGVDALRALTGDTASAFMIVFGVEAALFLCAATMASRIRIGADAPAPRAHAGVHLQGAQT